MANYTEESKKKLMSCAKSIKIYCNDMLDTDGGCQNCIFNTPHKCALMAGEPSEERCPAGWLVPINGRIFVRGKVSGEVEEVSLGGNSMTERDVYFDANGRPYFPKGFDIKKAERIMNNYMRHFPDSRFTFAEVASLLILQGTGYDGGTSAYHLCFLLGVYGGDRATLKRWKERAKP